MTSSKIPWSNVGILLSVFCVQRGGESFFVQLYHCWYLGCIYVRAYHSKPQAGERIEVWYAQYATYMFVMCNCDREMFSQFIRNREFSAERGGGREVRLVDIYGVNWKRERECGGECVWVCGCGIMMVSMRQNERTRERDGGRDRYMYECIHCTKTYIPTTLEIYWVCFWNVINPAN